MNPRQVADRLYGITLRPQELALYGQRVAFDLRYAPMAEPGDPPATAHFRLMVLEVVARLDPDDELARQGQDTLLVAKCGWELELATDQPCATVALAEAPGEAPLLLGRIADTINDLARRAGVAPPLGPEVVTGLLLRYRTAGVGAGEPR
jgi:hypothetical protein